MSDQNVLEELKADYRERTPGSKAIWEENRNGLVDGVGSQPRYVEPYPLAIESASGSTIRDVDGNEYVDVFNCFGGVPMLGHAPKAVRNAVGSQLEEGLVYGHPYPKQLEYTNALTDRYPMIDRLRLANSGTEANMNAIRLARSYTGRSKIVKIEGTYHGSFDDVFVSTMPTVDDAGTREAPTPRPNGAGVPDSVLEETIVAPFNDPEALESILHAHEGEIAAIIVEPVPMYATLVEPRDGYLQDVSSLAAEHGAVFVVDEVKTGCRIAYGGACEYYDLEPDLVTLGKAIGGGLPAGAFGGDAEIMREMSFQGRGRGNTENVGTYNANPLLVSAGSAVLEELTPEAYDRLEAHSERIAASFEDVLRDEGITATVQHLPSVGYVHFGIDTDVTDYRTGSGQRFDTAIQYWFAALEAGILPPPKTSAWYLTTAHTDADVDTIVEANKSALAALS
ncbi:aspartate aminotransferase family protein [Natrarchaeobius sp. A-rgal3]|uniref:aspartate aminotransferase family protein n=1 Tax=Natrarchaeobius versutus TaxID=1679078 RepID=UPI00350F0C85